VVELQDELNIPKNIQMIFPDEEKFLSDLDTLCEKALADVCTLYTPRKPEMYEIRALI